MLPAPLLKHLEGREDARPDEAMDRPGLDRSIDLGAEPERARLVVANALAARAAAGTGGRPPMQCIDVLIAGPPAFESPEAWPTDRLEDWGADSVKWLRSLLPPKTPLYSAHLHTDETSPHVHPAFPPALADAKGVVALSWKRMQAYMAESAAARPIKGGPAQLRALQDSYFREVGQKYGLERGKVGAQIEYAPLDRTEGLKRRVSGAEARAAEEQQRRTEAEKRATDSDAARRQAAAAAERERELRLETERRTAAELASEREIRTAAERAANSAVTRADQLEADAERRDGVAAEAEKRATDSDAARRQAAAATERERELRLETERRTAAELASEREIRTAAERAANSAVTRADQLEADAERRDGAAAEAEKRATAAVTLATKAINANYGWREQWDKREEEVAAKIARVELRSSQLDRKYNELADGVKLLETYDSGDDRSPASQLLLERDAATDRAADAERAARAATTRADTAEHAQQDAERRTDKRAAKRHAAYLQARIDDHATARAAAAAETDRERRTERHRTAATAERDRRAGYGRAPDPRIGQAPTRPTERRDTPARTKARERGQGHGRW